MTNLRSEFRRTLRTLARRPAFAVTAIGSLAIAIGLNTTMYSTLDALISPRVALRDHDNLYRFRFYANGITHVGNHALNAIMRSGGDVFESFTSAQMVTMGGALLESDEAFFNGRLVSVLPNYFTVIGAQPMYGRVFDSTDVTAPTLPVVISERTARKLFPRGGNPVGRKIDLEGTPYTIVGVMARESGFPLDATAAWILPPQNSDLSAIGYDIVRVRPNVTPASLDRTVHLLTQRFAIAAGIPSRDARLAFNSAVTGQFRGLGLFQYALIGAVLAVLLVACANIANLQLARGIARSRELATRAALGASRRDLVMHLLMESVILGAAGLVLGLTITFWGMQLVRASIPDSIGEYIVEPQTSWHLFVFAAIVTTVCVLFIGLLPGLRVSRVDLNELIKRGAGTGSTKTARRQYGVLVSAEIGFALAVVCVAALLVRSAFQLNAQERAWDQSMLTDAFLQTKAPADSAWSFENVAADIIASVRAQPDIADAAVQMHHSDADQVITATTAGGKPHVFPAPMWSYNVVTAGELRTLGLGVLHGRDFEEGERGGAAIVDPQLARHLWPGGSAVGQMIKFGAPDKPGRWYTVVGVRQPTGIESTDASTVGEAYVLPLDDDRLRGSSKPWNSATFDVIVRASKSPQHTHLAIRAALTADKRFNIWYTHPYNEIAAVKRANYDFIGALFGVFAVVAIALAALGVYGIVSHAVAERRRELGVRLALGSSARGILHAVLREGNPFALAGIAIGLFLISRTAPLVRHFLAFPEIDMYSIELYVPAAALLFAVAFIAAFVPALRATRIDPVEALRCE